MGWNSVAAAIALAGVAAVSPGARAQTAPTTLLHLSASNTVEVPPDLLVADLVAQDTAPAAATAQRRVNALMAEGMRLARTADGVQARAVGYAVMPADEKRGTWTAQQTLELRAADGAALLDLVGRLQAQGFTTASLDWQLSPDLRRRSHEEATLRALHDLRDRAAAAASALGLTVDHLQDVRLDGADSLPGPRPMMAMAARAAPAPQATAAPQEVTASASGDVVLRP